MKFREKYAEILDIVRDDIEQVNKRLSEYVDVKEPFKTNLSEYLSAPSKRIRSLLAFLYLRANNLEITEKHYLFQAAIELVHNASLIHDDIIDMDEVRRSKASLNKTFGNNLAVISGDYLLSQAMLELSRLNSIELIEMFAQTLKNMCLGEISQQNNKFKIPTLEEYLLKTEQKTASLFQSTINGSLLLTNCSCESLDFGKNFGMVFQIRDDLLNILSSDCSDIKDGIYNAPIIFAGNTEDLSIGIEKTYGLLNNYLERVNTSIKNLENNKYKQAIIELLNLLGNIK